MMAPAGIVMTVIALASVVIPCRPQLPSTEHPFDRTSVRVLPRPSDKNATRSNRCLNFPVGAVNVRSDAGAPRRRKEPPVARAKQEPDGTAESAEVREIPDGPADATGLTSR